MATRPGRFPPAIVSSSTAGQWTAICSSSIWPRLSAPTIAVSDGSAAPDRRAKPGPCTGLQQKYVAVGRARDRLIDENLALAQQLAGLCTRRRKAGTSLV